LPAFVADAPHAGTSTTCITRGQNWTAPCTSSCAMQRLGSSTGGRASHEPGRQLRSKIRRDRSDPSETSKRRRGRRPQPLLCVRHGNDWRQHGALGPRRVQFAITGKELVNRATTRSTFVARGLFCDSMGQSSYLVRPGNSICLERLQVQLRKLCALQRVVPFGRAYRPASPLPAAGGCPHNT
jgi:hypothetical protein